MGPTSQQEKWDLNTGSKSQGNMRYSHASLLLENGEVRVLDSTLLKSPWNKKSGCIR